METISNIKSKTDIIKETAEFYNISNRAVTFNNNCIYLDKKTGNKCAVGRCIKDDVQLGIYNTDTNVEVLFEKFTFDILKDEYRIEDIDFWVDLQRFHDQPSNWNELGLSNRGQIAFVNLYNHYSL